MAFNPKMSDFLAPVPGPAVRGLSLELLAKMNAADRFAWLAVAAEMTNTPIGADVAPLQESVRFPRVAKTVTLPADDIPPFETWPDPSIPWSREFDDVLTYFVAATVDRMQAEASDRAEELARGIGGTMIDPSLLALLDHFSNQRAEAIEWAARIAYVLAMQPKRPGDNRDRLRRALGRLGIDATNEPEAV